MASARASEANKAGALSKRQDSPFLAAPYLQLGHAAAPGKLVLAWHAADADNTWTVDYQKGTATRWQAAKAPSERRIAVAGVEPHRVYHVALDGLQPGEIFRYRVSLTGQVVFGRGTISQGRRPATAVCRFRRLRCRHSRREGDRLPRVLSRPDYVMITGDIVYGDGRIAEYRTKFWPILNAESASPTEGAPLLRSTLTVAAPGNHDIAHRDLDRYPDGLAYFYYWLQPLNGPAGNEGGPLVAPVPGAIDKKKAFISAAGDAFPRMANFSFDYGNTHWTVLDANPTVDWTNQELQQWVANDSWPPKRQPGDS